MSTLWEELLTKETITRGWHLARDDTRHDFSEDLYSADVYALDLSRIVQETINRLATNSYQPRPLFRIEVPKGPLAFRPGTVIPIQDRVVLSSLVLLMSPELDKILPDSVFSWRLKIPLPKKGSIFQETDITDLPFLKRVTIREEIDPFESWYRLWPVFDNKTREVFKEEGYTFLATSDISAYFENIQLPILRDLLLKHLHQETALVNLMCLFLESCCDRTGDGRAHHRGIPQGNFVSSFLGNFFLLPLDEALLDFSKHHDIKYFRYMDDVRVFTRSREDARRAILLMARTLRSLHLNVQTAKTRIYDESLKEVSRLLIDNRVDELSDLIDSIHKDYPDGAIPDDVRSGLLDKLSKISKLDAPGGQKILGARMPLEGLGLRAFNRWMTAHAILGSDTYIKRLLSEISKSADAKLTRKLVNAARRFPRKGSIESSVLRMIRDKQIIFPHQEAECLRALRYLSTLTNGTTAHCWARVMNQSAERYLRMESAYLLARTCLSKEQLKLLGTAFRAEPDSYVQVAMACLLVQSRENNHEIVRALVFHPNEKVSNIGKLFRTVKTDKSFALKYLRHSLRNEMPWLICDYMPFLHLMSMSNDREIRELLLDAIRNPRLLHPIGGVREILKRIFTRTRESLVTPTTT